ncbi:hypothetical protein [Muricoccus radiodurans]|uniref:hypothetical protein n=1 Tax=Muricoccus radiodurans TaxID=2231721 RepID=UPI003CEFAF0B
MAAGEAGGVDLHRVRHEVGARAVIADLQEAAGDHPADRGRTDEERGRPALGEEQVSEHGQRDVAQDDVAPERGDVPHRLLEPAGAERVRGVDGVAEREEDATVEGVGLALRHLRADPREGEHRPGDEGEAGEGRHLPQEKASQAAEARGEGWLCYSHARVVLAVSVRGPVEFS